MEGMNQILPMNGMMNQDSDYRYARSSDGEVVSRTNLRTNSIDGKRFVNTKLKGNTLINFVLPNGDNKVIGWCIDYQHSAIIYFIYNSLYNHSVLRYYQKTKVIEKIWYSRPSLGFEDGDIRAFVAGELVYWCNNSQPLKSFVLDWAANYTNGTSIGDGGTYSAAQVSNLATDVFPMIKKPPVYKPDVEYVDITEYPIYIGEPINFNNLRRRMFQFKYQYTYFDGQQSAWSPISKVPLPPAEVSTDGEWAEEITKNNGVQVTINTGNAYVEKITVAARECQDRDALGDFFTFDVVEKYSSDGTRRVDDNIDYAGTIFLNNKILTSINTEINNRYCDDVPLSASDMLLLDGKYIAIAMPVKGYDLEDVDYDLEAVEGEVDFNLAISNMFVYADGNDYYVTIPLGYFPSSDYIIHFKDYDGVWHTYTYASPAMEPPFYRSTIAAILAGDIEADKANVSHLLSASIVTGETYKIKLNFNYSIPPTGDPVVFTAYVNIGASTQENVYKHLKRGQYHPFVLIYNDGFGRYNIAQGDNELFSPYESNCPSPYRVQCRMSVNNKPPDWATTYRVGYIKNKSYIYLLQLGYVESFADGEELDGDPDQTYELPDGKYFLRINQCINRLRDEFPAITVANYSFVEGDRCRSICGENEGITYELEPYTATFEKTDDDGNFLTDEGFLIDANLVDIGNVIQLLEIYRPNVALQSTVFVETGDEYPIIDAGLATRRHGVNPKVSGDTEQTLDAFNEPSTPAILNLDFGDCYFRGRVQVNPDTMAVTATIVEDMAYSDFYLSTGMDIGRATAKIDSKQQELNSIVRSENWIEGSLVNNLNVFLFSAYHFDASDAYGRITGIVEMGGTLKVLQEHKEGSIMIGEVNFKDADNGDWIFIQDTVFGAYRRYPEDRGTTYRRSMASNVRYLYYFDESTGELIRSAPNGQAAVSKDYNMQNWFEKKAKQLREYDGDKGVVVSFNNDYEEVYVSFSIGDENETVVFSEKEGSKGWNHFITLYNDTGIPENLAFFKDNLFSFFNGQLYLHNSGANNTFFGKLHGCSVTAIVNQYATIAKRFSNIRVSTNTNIWDVEFNIPEGLNYPAQKSLLKPALFRERENALYSDILRSIINRAGAEDVNLLHTGQRMVGETMSVLISDSTATEAELGVATVNFLIAR